ncbi:formation of crista junctions protein 1 [Zymoseptoria brevis]|uniref:MICOS complex subunit MIC60 n=1 Tax=Zymoseptoria brevis TaxID=1047168 RepID=A0A0F4GEB6_9PEZI|nr:formation of crista junctions protein 1 [Zymoseptoria brevis]
MLRVVTRSNACLRHWQLNRIAQPLARAFADARTPDKIVLPGTQSGTVAGVPQPPILESTTNQLNTDPIPPSAAPLEPPTPVQVKSNAPASSTIAPSSITSPPPPPPKKKTHRVRSFFFTLFLLSAFGYAGGVYYSLVNDNFHDFFTEYVPGGEDAVAYFEEREFRKRFPNKDLTSRNWPQTRGENKVTIGRQSGVTPRLAEAESIGADLGQKGRHTSALEDNNAASKEKKAAPKDNKASSKDSKANVKEPTKEDPKVSQTLLPKADVPKNDASKASSPDAPVKAAPAIGAPQLDNINVPEATEPAVQELVKLVNNIITSINASPEAPKYASTLSEAKSKVDRVISEIKLIKEKAAEEADTQVKNAHLEFDSAAKELVRRLEGEMSEQETRWREEYEQEREKLSTSYKQKLSAELDAAKKVLEQKNQNALLEQEIALQKKFMDDVKGKIEEERNGRLSKLDELSTSVQELEKLTGQWNEVVDATLQTQHLQVALESVRAKLQESDTPTPFINELVALKEVSKNNNVVNAAIASINPVAYQRGVPSSAHLIDRFRRVAAEVRKASLLPEDAGVASHAASAVLSRFMFQKKADRGLPKGDDVEATLARTEVLLEEGDLDAAAREMNSLKGWAGVLSRDWVGECRRVLEVKQAVDVIATEARLQSLLVD